MSLEVVYMTPWWEDLALSRAAPRCD